MMRSFIAKLSKTLFLFIAATALITAPSAHAITIGAGPSIGIDKRGTVWYQEFQDWSASDLRALDPNNDHYKFVEDADTARDIVAVYVHDDGNNVFFRLDLFDLGYLDDETDVDVYVAIDCAAGGQEWLPDFSDTKTDHPWEAVIGVYQSNLGALYDSTFSTFPADYLGSYWHYDLDSVEFGIKRSFLTSRGWDGNLSNLKIQPFTTKNGTNNGAGEIDNQASDVVDAAGILVDRGSSTSNGWIRGSITADSTAGRAKYAVIAHANQSVAPRGGTQKHIFENRSDINLYPGFIRLLDSAEMLNTPINLHISGTLMMSFLWAEQNPSDGDYPDRDGPTFMARCRDFVTTGPGSLIGGVLAEHIMPYFEGEVNQKSIEQNSQLIQHYFGLSEEDMAVMHVPERVIRSNTNSPYVSAEGPLDGKTFEDIEQSGFTATYLDEVTHLHWWFYPNETSNPGWDDFNCGRWAGGQGNDEEPYHHKVHKINGIYTFMINDREDQSKFGNDDGGMAYDTRYTLLDKALSGDSSQITIVFDDWEALAGNSFASPDPNNNADQFHTTLRWAANHQWIDIKNLKDVLVWATNDPSWVIDHGYVYDKSSQTYEWLKRASEQTYDHWYYGKDGLEENFFERKPVVHNSWVPSGMKKYGDMNTPGTLVRDSWDTIQSISSPYLKMISEWSYSAMIYETAWHDEDANPDQYKSRNYQVTFNRGTNEGNCDLSFADVTYDNTAGWALRLHGHVRDMGVMKAASDWIENIKNGSQGPETTVYAADIDDDTLDEYVLCNNRVFLCIERWGARVIKAFVYDPFMNGGDARMVVGVPVSNPPQESENENAENNRNSVFKDHWSTGQASNGYIDEDYAATAPTAGNDYWEFVSNDGRINKRITLPAGLDIAYARYNTAPDVDTLYVRNGLGPNQLNIMFNGTTNLVRKSDLSFKGLANQEGGEAYMVRGNNTELQSAVGGSGWDNRELPMIEIFELNNTGEATNFSMAVAFSEATARDADGDGLPNTNEWVVGTDVFNPDTDGDEIPDGWELANSLSPTNASDGTSDSDLDTVSARDEFIAGTSATDGNSYFNVADGIPYSTHNEIHHLAQSGRLYRIYYADAVLGEGWDWKPFANTNIPYGTYLHMTGAASHTFTDEFTSATSGSMPTNGTRLYMIGVEVP